MWVNKNYEAYLKITTCGSVDGEPTCLKLSSRKSFTRDSKTIYAWQWIILCSCILKKMASIFRLNAMPNNYDDYMNLTQ